MRQLGQTSAGTIEQINKLRQADVIRPNEDVMQRYRRLKTRERVRETSGFLHPNTPEESLELHGFLIRGDRTSRRKGKDRFSDSNIQLPSIYRGPSDCGVVKSDAEMLSRAIVHLSPRLSMAKSTESQSGLFGSEGSNEGLLYAVQNPSLYGRGSKAFNILTGLRKSLKSGTVEAEREVHHINMTEPEKTAFEAKGLKKLKKGRVLGRLKIYRRIPSAAVLKGYSVKQ